MASFPCCHPLSFKPFQPQLFQTVDITYDLPIKSLHQIVLVLPPCLPSAFSTYSFMLCFSLSYLLPPSLHTYRLAPLHSRLHHLFSGAISVCRSKQWQWQDRMTQLQEFDYSVTHPRGQSIQVNSRHLPGYGRLNSNTFEPMHHRVK